MKLLRELEPGEEVFVKMAHGFRLRLEHGEYRPPKKGRHVRKQPQLDAFFGLIVANSDFELRLRPVKKMGGHENEQFGGIAVIPYNLLQKVLVFTGQTNEDTVKTGRLRVVASTFSSYRGIAWRGESEEIPLEHPHHKPAERLFEEVKIG